MGLKNPFSPELTGELRRLAFLDNLRYLMVVFVLIYISVGAYATIASHWLFHDTGSLMVNRTCLAFHP